MVARLGRCVTLLAEEADLYGLLGCGLELEKAGGCSIEEVPEAGGGSAADVVESCCVDDISKSGLSVRELGSKATFLDDVLMLGQVKGTDRKASDGFQLSKSLRRGDYDVLIVRVTESEVRTRGCDL